MYKSGIYKSALFFMVLFLPYIAVSQEFTVSGKVTDQNTEESLPGVNILVKGTNTGKITDYDGVYSIKLNGPATLVFSYLGYKSLEVQVDHSQVLDVKLEVQVAALDEVIIIGYGTQKKSDKTGAVSNITSADFNQGVLTDPVQGIQGKVAGVLVSKKGGDPNSGFIVKIRGAAGFDAKTQPLYVIDGVPNADPTALATEDIESWTVLKDASSAAIYGSQASNGVIIVTTKKGTQGRSSLQLNLSVSADRVAKKLDMLSASDLRKYVADNGLNFTDGGANVDWQDQIYRTGITQNYNLSYSGGHENSSYYGSITHSDWEGVMKGTSKARNLGKVNLLHKALDNKLTLSGSLAASFEKNDYENYDGWDKDDIVYQALSHNPTDSVRLFDGTYNRINRDFNYENPLSVINGIDNIRDSKNIFGNFKAELEILPGLNGIVNLGYTRDDHENSYFRPKNSVYSSADNGFGKKTYENTQQKLIELTANYFKAFDKQNIRLMIGYSWQQKNWNGFYAQAENPQSDFMKYNNLGSFVDITSASISSWAGESRLIGFFGRMEYNFNNKYFLNATLRCDGSSKFGVNNKWGWFPTASAGWNIHSEPFLQSYIWINQLRFRVGYGVSGNQAIGEYHSQLVIKSTGVAVDPETGEKVTTFEPAWNENPDLKWERTTETNLGLDFAFLRNRISGSFEFYTKYTSDLLGEYEVPKPPNLARKTFANSGNMRNTGVELFVQIFAIDKSNIKWKTTLNVTHFKTVIGDLGDWVEGEERKDGYVSGRGLVGELNYVTGNIEGKELGAFYLPRYVRLSDDGMFLYESETGGLTRDLDKAKRYIAGSPSPDLEIGWSNTLTFFKKIDLDFSIRTQIGNDVYNATRMFFDYPGLLPNLNALPEAVEWQKQGRKQPPTIADIYVEDGSFVRMDYMSLSYNFLLKNKYVKTLKAFVLANNLFTITGYSGVDPETAFDGRSFGIDKFDVYPKTRSFQLGLTANF